MEMMEEIEGLHLFQEKLRKVIVLYMKPFVIFTFPLLLEGLFMCDYQKWQSIGK